MREMGIQGVRRAKAVRTTRPTDGADRPADLLDRDFTAEGPNRLGVTDLTHVGTHAATEASSVFSPLAISAQNANRSFRHPTTSLVDCSNLV